MTKILIESYLNLIFEVDAFKKNSVYKKEDIRDKYLKYTISAFFGGWPGVSAYYLWRRRDDIKKELKGAKTKEKVIRLKQELKIVIQKLKVEKRKFVKKIRKKYNENK